MADRTKKKQPQPSPVQRKAEARRAEKLELIRQQVRLPVPEHGLAVREQKMIEVEREQALEGGGEAGLHALGVLPHEVVRDEAERTTGIPLHHAVGDDERASGRDV